MTHKDSASKADSSAAAPKSEREKRLQEALRANLRRRKSQARDRSGTPEGEGARKKSL